MIIDPDVVENYRHDWSRAEGAGTPVAVAPGDTFRADFGQFGALRHFVGNIGHGGIVTAPVGVTAEDYDRIA